MVTLDMPGGGGYGHAVPLTRAADWIEGDRARAYNKENAANEPHTDGEETNDVCRKIIRSWSSRSRMAVVIGCPCSNIR
jgi:hypothetical protein